MSVFEAFTRGVNFADALQRRQEEDQYTRQNRQRTTEARDALVDRFGVEAGDPTSLGQLEGIDQRRTGFANEQEDRDRGLRQQALRNAGMGYRRALETTGDPQQAFGIVGRLLQRLGYDEGVIAEAGAVLTENPGAIDALMAMIEAESASATSQQSSGTPRGFILSDGREVVGVPMRDGTIRTLDGQAINDPGARLVQEAQGTQRIQLGFLGDQTRRRGQDRNVTQGVVFENDDTGQPARVRAVEGGREAGRQATAERQRIQSLQNLERNASVALRDAQTALDAVSQAESFQSHGPLSATRRIAAARIPGTTEYDVERAIQSFMDNVGIDQLLNIKREGSGLGHVPQAQLVTLQSLLGRLEVGRDPQLLQRDLRDAIAIYQQIISGPAEELAALGAARAGIDTSGRGPGGRQQQQAQEQDDISALLELYGD